MPLFEPVWKTNKEEKLDEAMAAVRGISDPKKLYEIALTAGLSEVRCEAVYKITDQQILRSIVIHADSAFDARKEAIHRITDENILAEIAVMRSCYPADGEAIARLENQELLKRIAMSESGWEQSKAVYKIRSQADLKEIAEKGEKAVARKTAIRSITDPAVLLDIMESSCERFIITEAFHRFDDLLRQQPDDGQNSEWHDRYLEIVLKETQKDSKVNLDYFQQNKDLDRIYNEAKREDLRAEAFSRLIAGKVFSPHNLKEACKQAYKNYISVQTSLDNPWDTVLGNLEARILNSHDPSLFLECVEDPEAGCNFAAACIGELFGDRFRDEVGIDWIQDEAVSAFITNLNAYAAQNELYTMDYCLTLLADAVSPEISETKWYRRFLRRVR